MGYDEWENQKSRHGEAKWPLISICGLACFAFKIKVLTMTKRKRKKLIAFAKYWESTLFLQFKTNGSSCFFFKLTNKQKSRNKKSWTRQDGKKQVKEKIPPSLTIQVWSLGPTWWKRRTPSQNLPSSLHVNTISRAPMQSKQISVKLNETLKSHRIAVQSRCGCHPA